MVLAIALLMGIAQTSSAEGRRVLVIVNAGAPDSERIGRYYVQRRKVPAENLLVLRTVRSNDIAQERFETEIREPVLRAIQESKNPIDFLLFVRGVPFRVQRTGYAVDSLLMAEGLPTQRIQVGSLAPNPYFEKNEPFSRKKFGMTLACRLDGYTAADAIALIDHSLAAKPLKGPFFFDKASNRRTSGYKMLQDTLDRADTLLRAKGLTSQLEDTEAFVAPPTKLAGYASWGSNDGKYSAETYRKLLFAPGAIAETFVSTSGRTFMPQTTGQSLIADLIAQGVTGVKGYVSEPYTIALAHADLLFDRYTSGRNLAESFYAASPVTGWKDIVIGDPLCAPYRK